MFKSLQITFKGDHKYCKIQKFFSVGYAKMIFKQVIFLLILCNVCHLCLGSKSNQSDTEAVENFRRYLRIRSVQPNVDYTECLEFIREQATSLGLPMEIYNMTPTKPVVILTWKGKNSSLPSILLNSHMDVVPVNEEKWVHPPFGADLVDGKIFARGAQDMKSVGIQYLEAIKRLKAKNVALQRTIHVSFVPDEEIGGTEGMAKFVTTKHYEALNVGVALDEGMPSPYDFYGLSYAERTIWQFVIKCTGSSGHASIFLNNTAGEKVAYVLDKIYKYRAEQEKKMNDQKLWLGDVTTINLTIMKGGTQTNVIPSEFTLTIDCRIAVNEDLDKWKAMVYKWCSDAGEGVSISDILNQNLVQPTDLSSANIYWTAFKSATDAMNMTVTPLVLPGGSDSRFIRNLGTPVFGFSPIINTAPLLHSDNEYLDVSTFLKGIEIYINIISKMGNI